MIPVYINNFNRLEPVKALVDDLSRMNSPTKITIVDNASCMKELLKWYLELSEYRPDVRVVYQANNGPRGYWRCMDHGDPYYVVCDPDVDISTCPNDMLCVMVEILSRNPSITKIGPSIRIDDVPKEYPFYERVQLDEGRFYKKKHEATGWWEAEIDTAFAMCRTGTTFTYGPALRGPDPYVMRHLPFYEIPGKLSPEMKFYLENMPEQYKRGIVWSTLMQDSKQYV